MTTRNPQRLYAERSGRSDETVRPPWRHGEGGRNDRPAGSKRPEVTEVPKVATRGLRRPRTAPRAGDGMKCSWLYAGNSEDPTVLTV